MLANDYLLLGLNALSRAHELSYFLDGHREEPLSPASIYAERTR